MKNYRFIQNLFILVLIAAASIACSSDNEDIEPELNYYIRAKIDGAQVEMKEQKTLQGLAGKGSTYSINRR